MYIIFLYRIHIPTCGFTMGANRIQSWSRRRVAILHVVTPIPSSCAFPVDASEKDVPDRIKVTDVGWAISRTPVNNRSLQVTHYFLLLCLITG